MHKVLVDLVTLALAILILVGLMAIARDSRYVPGTASTETERYVMELETRMMELETHVKALERLK